MVKKILGLLAIILVIVMFMYKDLYTRVTVVSTLFSGAEQYENFSNFYNYIDSSTLSPSPSPSKSEHSLESSGNKSSTSKQPSASMSPGLANLGNKSTVSLKPSLSRSFKNGSASVPFWLSPKPSPS